MPMPRIPVLIAVLALGAGAAAAQDVDLVVRHTLISEGKDGIKRTIEFSERVVRRQDEVWIQRDIPLGWHADSEHAVGGKAHKHLDVAAAARWIQRDKEGKLSVRLASFEDKVLVDVAPTDYGNIGFDGSWPAAYHLLDPSTLKRLKVSRTAGSLTTYVMQAEGRSLTVVWNERLQYPVSVESVEGRSRKRTAVQAMPAARSPWDAVKEFQRKDYADYLD